MAENAALRAHADAREEYEGRLQGMQHALAEARNEIAHLVAERGAGNPKDEILAHWIRHQAEQAAHKDKVLFELLSTLIQVQAAETSAVGKDKNLETRIQILKKAFHQATAENAKLKKQVGELRRRGHRTAVPRTATPGTSYPGAPTRPQTRARVARPSFHRRRPPQPAPVPDYAPESVPSPVSPNESSR